MESKHTHEDELLNEIKQLRADLRAMKEPSHGNTDTNPPIKLHFWVENIPGDRKPFLIRCQGLGVLEIKTSAMRAAIMLGLFLDLEAQTSGTHPKSELIKNIGDIYQNLIEKVIPEKECAELVRVGLYRFEISLGRTPILQNTESKITYNDKAKKLEITHLGRPVSPRQKLHLTVSTTNQKLLSIIDSQLSESPLTRIRNQGAMYISSTELGWDKLFLEYFKHDLPVCNSSLFYRPGIVTYPDDLLELLGASRFSVERKGLMLQGYRAKRIQFNEYLNRQSLYDMVLNDSQDSAKIYGQRIPNNLAKRHVEEMIHQLESFAGYNLTLTSATFPFIVGVVEIGTAPHSEAFSMFYRLPTPGESTEVTCFALADRSVASSILAAVIPAVACHPSTIADRKKVIAELKGLLEVSNINMGDIEE